MPFDIPTHLDFEVEFEPTKMDDKKYVINQNLVRSCLIKEMHDEVEPKNML